MRKRDNYTKQPPIYSWLYRTWVEFHYYKLTHDDDKLPFNMFDRKFNDTKYSNTNETANAAPQSMIDRNITAKDFTDWMCRLKIYLKTTGGYMGCSIGVKRLTASNQRYLDNLKKGITINHKTIMKDMYKIVGKKPMAELMASQQCKDFLSQSSDASETKKDIPLKDTSNNDTHNKEPTPSPPPEFTYAQFVQELKSYYYAAKKQEPSVVPTYYPLAKILEQKYGCSWDTFSQLIFRASNDDIVMYDIRNGKMEIIEPQATEAEQQSQT